jgi:hypothetical protein
MTLLDYANWVPLPAPVTTGTTVQSFTSPDGEVWVAANGVNSGQWRRARDVLNARWYRNAAFTPGTYAALSMDTATRDVFGLYNSGTGLYTIPVAGLYTVLASLGCTTPATGTPTLLVRVTVNGTVRAHCYGQTALQSAVMTAKVADQWYLSVGDTIGMAEGTLGVAMTSGQTGDMWTWLSIAYTGTG